MMKFPFLRRLVPAALLAAALTVSSAAQEVRLPAGAARHVIVYRESGRFTGWPANNGAWIWDNEILVGFVLG